MHYEQLTQDQRYHISGLLKAGNAQNNIAKEVGVDKSTISRELRRNRGERGYRPKQAEELAVDRRVSAAKHISFTAEMNSILSCSARIKFNDLALLIALHERCFGRSRPWI